jgi:hypothetical protein
MFRTVPLSIIRSFSTVHTAVVYVIQVCWQFVSRGICSCSQAVSKPVWHIPLLCVQWKTPDDGQKNCPKHVEFNSEHKFEKLVHLVGFIVRNLTQCTVTWTSEAALTVWISIIILGFEILLAVVVKGGSHRLISNTSMLIPDCMLSHPWRQCLSWLLFLEDFLCFIIQDSCYCNFAKHKVV